MPLCGLRIGPSAPVSSRYSRHPHSLPVPAIPTSWCSSQADPSSIHSPLRRQRWRGPLLRCHLSHHSSSEKVTNSRSCNLISWQAGTFTTTSGDCRSFCLRRSNALDAILVSKCGQGLLYPHQSHAFAQFPRVRNLADEATPSQCAVQRHSPPSSTRESRCRGRLDRLSAPVALLRRGNDGG